MTLIDQAVLFLLAAVIAVPLFNRVGLGSVLAYLSVGLLLGPWGVGLVDQVEAVLHFAELGVVLLLFIIGLELQPSRLWVLRRAVFGLGGLQVALSGAALGAAGVLLGLDLAAAVAVGLALALSSTAFVLQTLAEKGQLTTAHGRAAFAVLLFQDLAVVPILALLPLLAPGAALAGTGWTDVLQAAAVIVAVVIGGHYGLRPVLRHVAAHASHDVFVAAALAIVLGVAALMHHAGLSMAMGAFVAGVLLADSEYRHQLEADLMPFKGLLLGLFFIAVGMSANLGLVLAEPLILLGLTLGLVAVKAATLYAAARLSGRPNAAALGLALDLGQGGEFAFVLLGTAVAAGVVPAQLSERLVVVVTLSMALSPLLFALNGRVVQPRFRRPATPVYDDIGASATGGVPVIIAGFGRFGQIVGRALRVRRIAFTALDRSPEQIEVVRRFGGTAYYGDAARGELLRAAGAGQARILVVAVDDVATSLQVVEQARVHHPHLAVYARARNRKHAHLLMDLGVSHVVRETLHSSLALAEDVLRGLGTDPARARRDTETFRVHDEALLAAQQAIHHDEQHLIQSTREAAEELDALMRGDDER